MGVEKRCVARGGKNIIFRRGGGINIVFGPKYRPLADHKQGAGQCSRRLAANLWCVWVRCGSPVAENKW